MKIELVGVIGGGSPLILDISQFLATDNNGTPLIAAGVYGGTHSHLVAHAGDGPEFSSVLSRLGYTKHAVAARHVSAADLMRNLRGVRG